MTPLNYTYVNDLDKETSDMLGNTRLTRYGNPHCLRLLPNALTPDGTDHFPLVHAYTALDSCKRRLFRFQVRTNFMGITISVRCTDPTQYIRYRAIRSRMHSEPVEITFPSICVSHTEHGLHFVSDDFKIKPHTDPREPLIMI